MKSNHDYGSEPIEETPTPFYTLRVYHCKTCGCRKGVHHYSDGGRHTAYMDASGKPVSKQPSCI